MTEQLTNEKIQLLLEELIAFRQTILNVNSSLGEVIKALDVEKRLKEENLGQEPKSIFQHCDTCEHCIYLIDQDDYLCDYNQENQEFIYFPEATSCEHYEKLNNSYFD